jgi:ketosteroid isomerase-like protein
MSQENVEVVRGLYAAAARRDNAAVYAIYADDIEWDATRTERGAVTGQMVHGHAGLQGWLREWYGAWENIDDNLEEVLDAGDDEVLSVMTQRGRGRVSGAEVEDRLATIWTVREGRIIRAVWFPSKAEALEAVGLSEESMPQENVEIVRRVYDAAARRDAATVLALYDPDIQWDGSRSRWAEVLPGRQIWRGHAELRATFRAYYEAWDDLEDTLEELIDAGDRVISVTNTRARGRSSGVEVEWNGQAGVWTIREGRVIQVTWFPTREEALEAVGRSE